MDVPVECSFLWGRRRIRYELDRTDRERLKITVTPSCKVHVTAPSHADMQDVHERVRRKGHWIVSQIEDFEQYRPRTPPRQYISGETHLLRGVQYRLRIVAAPVSCIYLKDNRIVLETPHSENHKQKAALLDYLYRLEARQEFPERLGTVAALFANLGVEKPRLIIRKMTKRWGSHTVNGNLVLNLDLIRAPIPCIDYVIAHELAHAVAPDHGVRWRNLMDKAMSDWRDRKKRLETSLL
ncbi:MAG: SprT family zinc-dependent metalloprotease [Bryobacterales bacterium]|nr:SprT family zinc-dependent metalloprotease [Bryobacterales bacterium]